MSKNPNCKSNDDDEDDDDDADDETLRRGCCVKRRTRHVTRVHLGGGHGTGHSEQSGDIWIRKESTPRCPWLLITSSIEIAIWKYTLSDTRIVRGKKHGQC